MAPTVGGPDDERDRGRGSIGDHHEQAATPPASPVEEAIQAACGSLLALRASLASASRVPGEHGKAEPALAAAIDLVHEAIATLRQSTPRAAGSPWSLGFVARGGTVHTLR
jgi:hypothetical protein